MENQIPETEQWLLEGDCDKCRKEKYCDKDCSAYKKTVAKALHDAYMKALRNAQSKWNEEHPYVDQNGNRYATAEEAKQADERIEAYKNAKKDKDNTCIDYTIPTDTRTDNDIIEGEQTDEYNN